MFLWEGQNTGGAESVKVADGKHKVQEHLGPWTLQNLFLVAMVLVFISLAMY